MAEPRGGNRSLKVRHTRPSRRKPALRAASGSPARGAPGPRGRPRLVRGAHRRSRAGKIGLVAGVLLVLAVLGGSIYGGVRFYGYVFGYQRHEWNPASGGDGPVSYYYVDWREDYRDLRHLRESTREGPLRTRLTREVDGVVRYDPIAVIQLGLSLCDQLLDQPSPEREAVLLHQVEWLQTDGVVWLPGGIPVWPCYWEAKVYGIQPPWISAIAQGQAISLFVRMARRTGDPKYLDLAGKAVRAFFEPGLPLVWRGDDGRVFFEEYPTDPPSHVLNGCLCAWLGLWDYARETGDPRVREFCTESLKGIQQSIPEYELGDWTRYDVLQKRPVSPNYQEIHAALAESIWNITGDPFWRDRARRWRRAADDRLKRIEVFFEVLRAKAVGMVFHPGPEARPAAGEKSWPGGVPGSS